ncbi:glycosyltransferase [Vibrio mediterranei]|uniref:glycosyltransferase family 2 protein n=1 Tax=Vibrio mediterranei TaxID=689 RepID=UPI0038CE548F
MKKLLVSIVNFRSLSSVKKLVEDIKKQKNISARIIIVDNSMCHDEYNRLCEELDDRAITVIEAKKNLGYAKANNIALRLAQSDEYCLVVNPDIHFKNAMSISELLRNIDELGLDFVGPRFVDEMGVCAVSHL